MTDGPATVDRPPGIVGRLERAFYHDATFPHRVVMPVRFSDLDLQQHVNNVSAMLFIEEGRAAFHREMNLAQWRVGAKMLVVGMCLEYAAELHYPGQIEVLTGVRRMGRRSFTLGQVVRQNDNTCIYAEGTMVAARDGKSIDMPREMRSALAAHSITSGVASR